MKLSIVSTLYRSAPYIEEFHRRCRAAAEALAPDDYEIVLVNDGSPDNSLQLALEIFGRDPRVRVVDLARNFGHHKAIMAGLEQAAGELVFLIDSDLEEEPEWLERFHATLTSRTGPDTVDVVYGVQQARRGSLFERLSGRLFWQLINRLAEVKIPQNLITARLMRRRYVDALLLYQESELFLGGVWSSAGFVQEPLSVRKLATSPTDYTLGRRLGLAANAILSFSAAPLKIMAVAGIAIMLVSAVFGLVLIGLRLSGGVSDGWTSLSVMLAFFGGLNLFSTGLVGLYASKIFMEVKRRPNAIVRQVYRAPADPPPSPAGSG